MTHACSSLAMFLSVHSGHLLVLLCFLCLSFSFFFLCHSPGNLVTLCSVSSRSNCAFVCPSFPKSFRCRASGARQRSGGLLPVLQAFVATPPVGRPAAGPHAGRPRPWQQPEPAPDLCRHGGRSAKVLLHQARGSPEQSESAQDQRCYLGRLELKCLTVWY